MKYSLRKEKKDINENKKKFLAFKNTIVATKNLVGDFSRKVVMTQNQGIEDRKAEITT